jgi:Flp pilus assembly protein TadG
VLPTLQGMGRFSRGVAADRGAAALEFALVLLVLLPLVFGMIDYGLYFANDIGARDGANIAARQGVVENFTGDCSKYDEDTSLDPQLDSLACLALDQASPAGGTGYARVTNPERWKAGNDLVVCVAIVDIGVTGYTPLPGGGNVHARVTMRIEQDTTKSPQSADLEGEASTRHPDDPAPPSDLWTGWCP